MIDSHISIITDQSKYSNKLSFTIEDCLKEMKKAGIDKAIVTINPSINKIFCQKDHKIKFYDTEINQKILIKCIDCGKDVYKGINPYRKLNEQLIAQCSTYKRKLFPLLYIPVLPKLSQLECKYYEEEYQGEFFGYKFQPSLSNNKISTLTKFNSSLPALIHSGRDKISNPSNILEFSKRYKGNIIISHFAKFKKSVFDFININNNVFVNSSPTTIMFQAIKESPERLFNTQYLGEVISPGELYNKVLNFLSEDKLLFGSDYPVSSIEKEKSILESARLSEELFEKISYTNIIKAYDLDKILFN